MAITYSALQDAFMMASIDGMGEQEVYLSRETGEVHWHNEFGDNIEELPDDVDDATKYVRVPGRKDLDLGRPLVMSFVEEHLPDDFDDVRRFFGRRGAYAKFRALLTRRRALDRWYDFEAKAEERALREWCKDNGVTLED